MSHPSGDALAANDAAVEAVADALAMETIKQVVKEGMEVMDFDRLARAAIAAYESAIAKLDVGT